MATPKMTALDQSLGEVEVPQPDPAKWAEQFAGIARQMRAVIGRHRDIVPASIGFFPGGGRALDCHERVLAILRTGGLSDGRAVAGPRLGQDRCQQLGLASRPATAAASSKARPAGSRRPGPLPHDGPHDVRDPQQVTRPGGQAGQFLYQQRRPGASLDDLGDSILGQSRTRPGHHGCAGPISSSGT